MWDQKCIKIISTLNTYSPYSGSQMIDLKKISKMYQLEIKLTKKKNKIIKYAKQVKFGAFCWRLPVSRHLRSEIAR